MDVINNHSDENHQRRHANDKKFPLPLLFWRWRHGFRRCGAGSFSFFDLIFHNTFKTVFRRVHPSKPIQNLSNSSALISDTTRSALRCIPAR